jgi:hypothetical protein
LPEAYGNGTQVKFIMQIPWFLLEPRIPFFSLEARGIGVAVKLVE